MNELALTQYRANKRRLAKVYQGRAMPRLHHLSRRFYSPEGFFKIIDIPAPGVNMIVGIAKKLLDATGLSRFPLLSNLTRREQRWRQ